MSAPKPLRELVAELRDPLNDKPYRGCAWAADQLEAALDEWEAQIRSGIEQRKTQQSPGPLYSLGTNQAANDILEHILGAKTP